MKRNALGQTEAEFLAAYDPSKYERPSVTVDIAVFCRGKVLLIKRGNHPFIGSWALPGGFVNPDETCEQAAARELKEETGVESVPEQLHTYSDPHRDPRTRIITVAYTAGFDTLPDTAAGDDAADAKWFDISLYGSLITLKCGDDTLKVSISGQSEDLASDHGLILTDAMKKLGIIPLS